jgi:hypothetical protein
MGMALCLEGSFSWTYSQRPFDRTARPIGSPRISAASAFVTNAHDGALAGSRGAADALAAGAAAAEGCELGAAAAALEEGAPLALGCERLQEQRVKNRAVKAGRRFIAHSSHGRRQHARLAV